MTKLSFPVSQPIYRWYQDFWIKYYFKYVLPKITSTTHAGVRLDLSHLSLKVRNRILNVGYEDHEKQMCQDFLKPDDSVLEIGGAIGFIGLFCQKLLGIKKYITVEANPLTVEILKKNYELNNLTPNVWNLALARTDGKVQLNVGGDFWENFVTEGAPKNRVNSIEVSSVSMESLLEKAGPGTNVLIIDIEGAESCIDFSRLPENITKLIIEIHPAVLGHETTYDIISKILSRGFRVAREEGDTFAFLRK